MKHSSCEIKENQSEEEDEEEKCNNEIEIL